MIEKELNGGAISEVSENHEMRIKAKLRHSTKKVTAATRSNSSYQNMTPEMTGPKIRASEPTVVIHDINRAYKSESTHAHALSMTTETQQAERASSRRSLSYGSAGHDLGVNGQNRHLSDRVTDRAQELDADNVAIQRDRRGPRE